ncbi:MAG: hypothetical protein IJC56_09630 [Clostridia bacterium]|nr:hypothetical protein [Clostridia bacterium]
MNQQTEEMRLYFNRVRPMCRELFAMAFAICADYDGAEYALQRVILSGWQGGRRLRSKRGFREGMRAEMRRVALTRVRDSGSDDWDQFGSDPLDEGPEDMLMRAIQHEDAETRRVIMLKYGCSLSNSQIGRAMAMPASHADQLLSRFLRRIKRRLDSSGRSHLDAQLKEVCQRQLAEGGAEMPDMGAIYRNFEAEAAANYSPVGHFAGRAFTFIVAVAMLIAMGCVFWGVSAIIRPAEIEDSGLLTETLDEQADIYETADQEN